MIGYLVLGNSPSYQETNVLDNFQFHKLEYPHIHHHYHSLLHEFHIYFGLYSNSKNCHWLCRFHGHCNWLQLHMQLSRMKKNRRPVLFCFEYPPNPFKSSLTREIETHKKGAILQNFNSLIRFTVTHKRKKSWCFVNLSVSLVKDDFIGLSGNLPTRIGHKASQLSIQDCISYTN